LIYLNALPGSGYALQGSDKRRSGRNTMLKLIAVAGFALLVATSAEALTPAPMPQPDSLVSEVAAACGVGRTRINGVCVARTTVRQTRRAVRRY
jgi:hypothetical protein